MNKKIIDILSPKEAEKKGDKKFSLQKPHWPPKVPKIKLPKKTLIFILLILAVAGVFSYSHFALARAKIEIWPKTERLTFETELTVDEKTKGLDFLAKTVPGKISERVVEEIIQKFPSSDKVLTEKRAEGIIRVYNAYSTSPQILVARTRFVSADGKLFRTPTKITIPGGHYEKGKLVPGFLDIKIMADQPGEEYNIGPTTFSIPGFAGTPRFVAFYGKSFKPMAGGEVREVVLVSQEDLDRAKASLNEKATEICFTALKNETTPKFDFLKEAIETKILESSADVEVGTEIGEFNFQAKARCRALVFKIEDIRNFAIELIADKIVENKIVVPESLKINYFLERADLEKGKMVLSLALTADAYSAIDRISLQKGLIGKSLTEARALLENLPQVNRAYVRLWPFWLKGLPEDLDKINIELRFDPVEKF